MSAISERLDLERRHDRLVSATHEAIRVLRAPFGENDHVPGVIEDAIETLERGLRPPG